MYNISELKFWCQKVIPLVYDDSLTYYELLCKISAKLNELIDNSNDIPTYIEEMIKNYITSGDIERVLSEILAHFILNVKYPPNNLKPASGDGTTNDTEAIQGCIDYAAETGKSVYLPSGSYLSNSLTLKNNVSLMGSGRYSTKLVLIGGEINSFIKGNSNNNQISNLTIDGKASMQTNNINIIDLTGENYLFSDLILNDGYNLIKLNCTGHVQITNIICNNSINNSIVIEGDNSVELNNIVFNFLSSIGETNLKINSSYGIYKNIIFNSNTEIPFIINGNYNKIEAILKNSFKYQNNGSNNTIIINDSNYYINVKMFGAKGDGITDDSDAFQLAINSGLDICVPTDTVNAYILRKTINMPNDQQVIFGLSDGENPHGYIMSYATPAFYVTGNSNRFTNITFSSGNGTPTSPAGSCIICDATNNQDNSDIKIENCFLNSWNNAIENHGRGMTVESCLFVGNNCISQYYSFDGSGGDAGQQPNTGNRACRILNNRYHGSQIFFINQLGNLRNAIISNNILDLGAQLIQNNDQMRNCVINGNNVFFSRIPAIVNTQNSTMEYCAISSNSFNSLITRPPAGRFIQNNGQFNKNNISGNIFDGSGGEAIWLQTASNGNVISNNTFVNINISNNTNKGAILIGSTLEDTVITNNYFNGSNISYAIFFSSSTIPVSGCVIANNARSVSNLTSTFANGTKSNIITDFS